MKQGRPERIAEEIRKVVTPILEYELADPHLEGIQVTAVKITRDLGLVRVYFKLLDHPERRKEVLKSLKKAAGHIRHRVSEGMTLKHAPQFDFFYDESSELQEKIDSLFAQINADKSSE